MIFVNPRPVRNLEWRGPNAGNQTFPANLQFQGGDAIWKSCGIRRSVLAPGVLIPFVEMKELVSLRFQVLSQPMSVCECNSFVEPEIISGPAPPAHRSRRRNPSVMEHA